MLVFLLVEVKLSVDYLNSIYRFQPKVFEELSEVYLTTYKQSNKYKVKYHN